MIAMIQIRNVPDVLHRKLKSRAALAGQSLSDYLLRQVEDIAARPTSACRAVRRSRRRPPGRARREVIVDASALIEVLLQTAKASAIETHLLAADEGLDAPHLIDIEVAQTLRRYVARGDLSDARATLALDALAQFPLRRHPHAPLLPGVWRWQHNLSASDASYVSLAEALDAPLVTRDMRLAHAVGDAITTKVV